ncbi:hypothetical protein L873DRAFT_1844159 [Choiromyces venosus 120613-1]|uniref:Uncharacterized protein n=1 Tax=Choiromyces venosus 120613-1 TaxID=1336337 RepID=A0A3N4JJJ9_9PEZI|nr:hypothetical protein L873DRAFT_1844159 [Choiromyces venosus 120613-1]
MPFAIRLQGPGVNPQDGRLYERRTLCPAILTHPARDAWDCWEHCFDLRLTKRFGLVASRDILAPAATVVCGGFLFAMDLLNRSDNETNKKIKKLGRKTENLSQKTDNLGQGTANLCQKTENLSQKMENTSMELLKKINQTQRLRWMLLSLPLATRKKSETARERLDKYYARVRREGEDCD